MKLLSNKNIKKYFFSKNIKLKTELNVDLVLSCEFYWVRIFNIPVNNEKQAIKVLPALFDDILPSKNYEYYCIQQENGKFLCFAFNNDDILEYIKKSGLILSQINSVYFAQTEMMNYNNFIINNQTYTYDNDILMKVPIALEQDSVELNNELKQISLSKFKINLKFYTNIINTRYIYTLLAMFLCILLLNLVRYSSYQSELSTLSLKVTNIRISNKIPKSNIQMNSILKEMETNVSKNIKIREIFSYILDFRKHMKKGHIENISYKDNHLAIVFKNINSTDITDYINKKYTIKSTNDSKNYVSIEVII